MTLQLFSLPHWRQSKNIFPYPLVTLEIISLFNWWHSNLFSFACWWYFKLFSSDRRRQLFSLAHWWQYKMFSLASSWSFQFICPSCWWTCTLFSLALWWHSKLFSLPTTDTSKWRVYCHTGCRQHGRSSQSVCSDRSSSTAPPGNHPGTVRHGARASDAVLPINAFQTDAHHLLPWRRQRRTVHAGSRPRAESHTWGVHEAWSRLPAWHHVHRRSETTSHKALLCW